MAAVALPARCCWCGAPSHPSFSELGYRIVTYVRWTALPAIEIADATMSLSFDFHSFRYNLSKNKKNKNSSNNK